MPIPRTLLALAFLAASSLALSQSAPTSYSITQNGAVPGASSTISRSGGKVLFETRQPADGATPAMRTLSLYDIAGGKNWTWNPDDKPINCSIATFSGDWGDPFAMTADVRTGIAKGDLKPAGTETISGVPAQVYAGVMQGANVKVWLDAKDNLVLRATVSAPGAPPTTVANVTRVSFAPPAASLFALPAACAALKPAPTPAEIFADETGDDGANYVSAFTGPGSSNSCNVVLRVVQAKTLQPIPHIQVAIDTTYNVDNPPHYESGVHNDGTETFSGGGMHEITSQVHNGSVSLPNLPPYFMLDVNTIHPGHGSGSGLVYRKCFGPTTVLLDVIKNDGSSETSDLIWVKSGKNSTPPAN